ncbi:MAG: nuoN, partial [Deltaproteobacteria bacterium]|nr:nuoN [Deltaproteobacteria bacterium]
METIVIPAINMAVIAPEVILSLFAMALLLINVFVKGESTAYLGYLSIAGIIVTLFSLVSGWGYPLEGFSGTIVQDNFAIFFKVIFLISAAMSILITDRYIVREGCNQGEIYPLILFATVGMMLMAAGTDLMTIFLGLEV